VGRRRRKQKSGVGGGGSIGEEASTDLSLKEQLLRTNVKRFRGGLEFKADRLVYHSTLGSRVTKKKKKGRDVGGGPALLAGTRPKCAPK